MVLFFASHADLPVGPIFCFPYCCVCSQVEAGLKLRLHSALRQWAKAFEETGSGKEGDRGRGARAGSVAGEGVAPTPGTSVSATLAVPPAVHVIELTNNVITLQPPLQQVCAYHDDCQCDNSLVVTCEHTCLP